MKPITPSEVVNQKEQAGSAIVFEIINKLIVRNWNSLSQTAFVPEADILTELCKRTVMPSREIHEKKLLFVEADYRKAGWFVEFRRSDYNANGFIYATGFLFGLEP